MPTIVRKSNVALMEVRRNMLHAVSWQVRSTVWNPPTDVYETDKAYIVRMEIAGMREEDFEVVVENRILHISGYRPDTPARRAYHQMEIRFGKFSASIGLPGAVDADSAHAEYKDGFLTVTLPKDKHAHHKVE